MDTDELTLVNVNVRLPREAYRNFKAACALRGTAVRSVVAELMQDSLKNGKLPAAQRQDK